MVSLEATTTVYQYILADNSVSSIETDDVCTTSATQNISTNHNVDNWGLDRIDQSSWVGGIGSGTYNYSRGGTGVDIYIIDTGIHFSHTEFGGRAQLLSDAINETIAPNGADASGHGTHVAALAAGQRFGVAKQALIYSTKVLNSLGSGSSSTVLSGINSVISHHNAKNSRSSVANMSFTFTGGTNTAVDAAVNAMIDAGIVVCVAAGNSNSLAANYTPSRVAGAITVGASTSSDTLSSFTNTAGAAAELDPLADPTGIPQTTNVGSAVDIFAPGVDILSAGIRRSIGRVLDVSIDPNTLHSIGYSGANQRIARIVVSSNTTRGTGANRIAVVPNLTIGTRTNLTQLLNAGASKPDVLLPGGNVFVISQTYTSDTEIVVVLDDNGADRGTISITIDIESDTATKKFSGTSMASPITAGVVALRLQEETNKFTSASDVATIHAFIVDNATPNALNLGSVDAGTPNKILYSPYSVADVVTWVTPTGQIYSGDESTAINTSVQANYTDLISNATSNLVYSSTNKPSWMNLSSTGVITGILPTVTGDTISTFTITATATTGTSSTRQFSVQTSNVLNQAPEWVTPSGSLGTVTEGIAANIQLNANDPESGTLTYSLHNPSETLPSGLSLSTSGLISGTPSSVVVNRTYTFTVRVSDGTEVSDRTFLLELVAINVAPVWNPFSPVGGPFELGPVNEGVYYNGDFLSGFHYIVDADADTITFSVTTGSLPNGFTLTPEGLLSGIDDTPGFYTFGITATDSSFSTERIFTFTVVDIPTDLAPAWITSSGSLGNIDEDTPSSFYVDAFDPEGGSVTFSLNLQGGETFPSGFTLNSDGTITGIADTVTTDTLYTFTIRATDETANSSDRSFSITIINVTGSPLPVWVTPAGSLGSMYEHYPSSFSVHANDVDDSDPVTYSITSGNLPSGLTLDSTTGEIRGIADSISSNTDYNFDVTATDELIQVARSFSITVLNYNTANTLDVIIPVQGYGKTQLQALNADLFADPSNVFRINDNNFGINQYIFELYLVSGLNLLPTGTVSINYENVFADSMDLHHTTTQVLLGDIQYAVVRDFDDSIKYEVLYAEIVDPLENADYTTAYPQADDPNHTQGITTITPNSITNMRQQLLNVYGLVDSKELMPEWMTSEQTVDDAASVIGWKPAVIISYVEAGTGSTIVDALTDTQKNIILNYPIIIDRYILSSAEALLKPTTFDGNTTTFDFDATTFDATETIPEINKYIKFPEVLAEATPTPTDAPFGAEFSEEFE